MKLCFMCGCDLKVTGEFLGDVDCPECGTQNTVYPKEALESLLEGEEAMGKLADRVNEKSAFIKLEIGEETPVMTYKTWKEVTGRFGETFRYYFDLETENGLFTKELDCGSRSFALQMDKIQPGTKVVIKRTQLFDSEGNAEEGKGTWFARVV
jgi:hypothetical protein